jgi:hypothetical protein
VLVDDKGAVQALPWSSFRWIRAETVQTNRGVSIELVAGCLAACARAGRCTLDLELNLQPLTRRAGWAFQDLWLQKLEARSGDPSRAVRGASR